MKAELVERPKWEIDKRLEMLVGHEIRVRAETFRPINHEGKALERWIPVDKLILDNGSAPDGLPVFFEGSLRGFSREVAVVYVTLDEGRNSAHRARGIIYYRGQSAVVLTGPAVVQISFPFLVEQLPTNPRNYWQDLRYPLAQFCFPFHQPKNKTGSPKTRRNLTRTAAKRRRSHG